MMSLNASVRETTDSRSRGGRSTVNDNCFALLNETTPCCDSERSDRSGDDKKPKLLTQQADYSVLNVRAPSGGVRVTERFLHKSTTLYRERDSADVSAQDYYAA